jgi:cephalosporin-C deacetylase
MMWTHGRSIRCPGPVGRFLPVRAVLVVLALQVQGASAQQLRFTPYRDNGTYAVGENVGWRVAPAPGQPRIQGTFSYSVRRDGGIVVDSGSFDVEHGAATIETSASEPCMLLVEVRPPNGVVGFRGESAAEVGRALLGAAVAPREIRPAAAPPQDFDAFWAAKLRTLETVPPEPLLTPDSSGVPGVEYAHLRLNNVDGAHVWAQLARPTAGEKLPALVIFQWASPPYPLQRSWVTDRAAQGWLVLDVEPHDVPADMPQAFYDALPERIKRYQLIGRHSRDESYFLPMYLGDYRAVEYLTTRPDWDGRTLVLMGTSMGGQQSLAVAGLHPKVTAVIANVPSGADVAGPLRGRGPAYPVWEVARPDILHTAAYFDPANFAPHIRARALVSMGFIDQTSTPTSVWAAFNAIPGDKDVVPLVDAPHNHLSTAAEVEPWVRRSEEWLRTLAAGPPPGPERH